MSSTVLSVGGLITPRGFGGVCVSGSAAISKTFEEKLKAKAHFPVLAFGIWKASYFPIALVLSSVVT